MTDYSLKECDAFRLFLVLDHYVPQDRKATVQLRTNMKGRKCYRYSSETKSIKWFVDFYTSSCFYCFVSPLISGALFNSDMSLVIYLFKSLGVKYEQIKV